MNDTAIMFAAIENALILGWSTERNGEVAETIWDFAPIHEDDVYVILFDHSFAKAFWGEREFSLKDKRPAWKVHLQSMVLWENPIEYVKKYGGLL